jgi:hypothetical protein
MAILDRRTYTLRYSALAVVVVAGVALLIASPIAVVSQDGDGARGLTTPGVIRTGTSDEVERDVAVTGPHANHIEKRALPTSAPALTDSDWTLVDTDTFKVYLPAGEALSIRFDTTGDSLEIVSPAESLTESALLAIDYAPDWLAFELKDAFLRLGPAFQDTFAAVILGSADPIVDEIAFTVAHTAPEILERSSFYMGLIVENAEDVYAHDPFLDYVDIVDYGSAAAGGDYYSTVRYRTAETGDTVEFELPRDRYYWDIVHIKVTDEIPTYINPANGAIADPPVGKFWRDFLFAHADSGYPILRDALDSCEVLWKGNVDNRADNGAIGIMTQWILDVMDFDSDAERPIQPVRIYRKHMGRCGEHADITAAAARAALIPTNSPLAMPDDHTWNEFYDQRWIHWEPVNTYVDSPWHYEGWGKTFVGIFNWRGDDWVWTVTERYTPYCTLSVAVSDSFGYPVDGAQVAIARKFGAVSYIEATWGSTDHNGLCQFLVGDGMDIFARIDSDIGSYPTRPLYRKAIEVSVAGEHYLWERSIANHRPRIPVEPMALPPGPDDAYQLRVNWEVASQFCYGQNRLVANTFSDHYTGGALEFFICDAPNYAAYAASDTFYAFEIAEDAGSGDVAFTCPTYDNWYAVLSNEEHVVNAQVVRGTAELYRRTGASVAGGTSTPVVHLAQNRPNPFKPDTYIVYALGRDTQVALKVFDVEGRLIRTLASGQERAGTHRVRWDGKDSRNRAVAPGIYLYRLETPGAVLSKKMVLLK